MDLEGSRFVTDNLFSSTILTLYNNVVTSEPFSSKVPSLAAQSISQLISLTLKFDSSSLCPLSFSHSVVWSQRWLTVSPPCEFSSNVMFFSLLTLKALLVGPFRGLVVEGS